MGFKSRKTRAEKAAVMLASYGETLPLREAVKRVIEQYYSSYRNHLFLGGEELKNNISDLIGCPVDYACSTDVYRHTMTLNITYADETNNKSGELEYLVANEGNGQFKVSLLRETESYGMKLGYW